MNLVCWEGLFFCVLQGDEILSQVSQSTNADNDSDDESDDVPDDDSDVVSFDIIHLFSY